MHDIPEEAVKAAAIADQLEERTKLKYMSPDGEECQIVPLTVIIEAAKALRALPFLPAQGGVKKLDLTVLERLAEYAEQYDQPDDNGPFPDIQDAMVTVGDLRQARKLLSILSALEPSAGRVAWLEEAARVAERHEGEPCRPAIAWTEEQRQFYASGQQDASSSIAAAIRALASHPVADKPDEAGAQGEEIERAEFHRGYVLACANIVNLHGPDVNVAEGFAQLNISRDDLKRLDLCDYDQNAINDLEDFWGTEKLFANALPTPPSSEVA